MPEITMMPAAALAAAIARGALAARDAVEAYLARIARVDSRVEAYVSVLAVDAQDEARRLDAEARAGRLRGILHGVPVAVKDLLAVRGVPMSAGSTMLGPDPAPHDAAAVRRLRDAGAVVLGVTALNEFAMGTTGVNPHSRTARNPWNLDRITGGSSSGSAAAMAAGLAAAAIGTDTGGSIRIPAALCGIVGLKPTFGRVSRAGVFPLAGSFDTVGPMVRTVEDAALLLEVLAGPDVADAGTIQAPPGRYRDEMARDPSGLRVGRLSGAFFESNLDPAVARGLEAVTLALERSGVRVVPVTLPSIERS
jgi:aspartyl-tRNA(Asn)/glutamyl-tRNA(Gln) amidotransferase subunit A